MRSPKLPITALLLAAFAAGGWGCREDTPSPTAPEPAQAVAPIAAAVAPLSFLQVSAGWSHACGVATDGRAWCWGNDASGQLGDGDAPLERCGDSPCSTRPVAVSGGLRFRHVRAGFDFSCGVTTGSQIYCWGSNDQGRLGVPTPSAISTTPVAIAGNRRWRQVRAGDNGACAISMAQTAFCWGSNNEGQLGNGTTVGSEVPVPVSAPGIQWSQLTVGSEHACGIATDGRGWCWGVNFRGELGDGTTTGRRTPVEVAGGLRFGKIDAGIIHTCAVTKAGQGYCWGTGQGSGDGTRGLLHVTPVAVIGHHTFANVSTSLERSCGVTVSGVGFCWGVNGGTLGNGKLPNAKFPVRLAGNVKFEAISVGDNFFSCGVATNGRAWCWGLNDFGNLGDGTDLRRSVPTAVAAPAP